MYKSHLFLVLRAEAMVGFPVLQRKTRMGLGRPEDTLTGYQGKTHCRGERGREGQRERRKSAGMVPWRLRVRLF